MDSNGTQRRTLTAADIAKIRSVSTPGVWPAIFYAPHQGDEAIGMAGGIQEHKAAGRPVLLVMLTRGESQGLLFAMNNQDEQGKERPDGTTCRLLGSECPAPGHWHNLNWSMNSLCDARTTEFYKSAEALGLGEENVLVLDNQPDTADAGPKGFADMVARLRSFIREVDEVFPGASHKFPAGWLDGNPTHKALSDAAYLESQGVPKDVRFYHIYAYQQRAKDHRADGADFVLPIQPAWMEAKINALRAYNAWEPEQNLHALGYHSAKQRMDPVFDDPREFVYLTPPDYKLGPLTA